MKLLKFILPFIIFSYSLSAQIIVVDHFESNVEYAIGANKVTFASSSDASINMVIENKASIDPFSKVDVDIQKEESYVGFAYIFEDAALNLESFTYLSLLYKTSDNLGFRLQFKNADDSTVYLSHSDFVVEDYNDENGFKKLLIPVANIAFQKTIKEIVVVFEESIASLNETSKQGTIYFNEFLMGNYNLGYMVIDAANDLISENSTSGLSGSFTEFEQFSIDYSLSFNNEYGAINFDNSENDYGGAYYKIGNDYSLSLSNYDQLEIDLWADSAELNPGNIKLEIKNNDTASTFRITGISESKTTFVIPLNTFSEPIQNINEFTMVFEKNKTDITAGRLNFDNIILRKGESNIDIPSLSSQIEIKQNDSIISDEQFVEANKAINLDIPEELLGAIESMHIIVNEEVVRLNYNINNIFNFELSDILIPNLANIQIKINFYDGSSTTLERKIIPWGVENALLETINFFKTARHENTGLYVDAHKINQTNIHPLSTGATSFSILSLVYEAEAINAGLIDGGNEEIQEIEDEIEYTLNTLLKKNPIKPATTDSGSWMYHWMDESLQQTWDSEFSTIDISLLVMSALQAGEYFSEVKPLAQELFNKVNWSKAINTENYSLYREMEQNGAPKESTQSQLFNEYFILLELSKMQQDLIEKNNLSKNKNMAISQMFDYYLDCINYSKAEYEGIELLTDIDNQFLSHFIYQFVYYLSPSYFNSEEYLGYYYSAYKTDSLFFVENGINYMGLGAGVDPNGNYIASNLENNTELIYNPAQMIGYMGIVKDKEYLITLLKNLIWEGRFIEDSDKGFIVFPRQNNSGFVASEMSCVDYGMMLTGLGQYLFPELTSQLLDIEADWLVGVKEKKNQENENFTIKQEKNKISITNHQNTNSYIRIITSTGVISQVLDVAPYESYSLDLNPGIYIITDQKISRKVVVF